MEIYEFHLEVPLPAGHFDKADVMAKLRGPVEAALKALAAAKLTGVKLTNGTVTKRGKYKRRKPRIVPPESVDTAPVVMPR